MNRRPAPLRNVIPSRRRGICFAVTLHGSRRALPGCHAGAWWNCRLMCTFGMSSRTEGEGSACRTVMWLGFGCIAVLSTRASLGLPGRPGIFSALVRGPLSFQKERGERKLLSAGANLPSEAWPGFFDEASCLVEKRRTSCPPPSGSPNAGRGVDTGRAWGRSGLPQAFPGSGFHGASEMPLSFDARQQT